MAAWAKAGKHGTELHLLVVPRASKTEIVGVHDGRLKVRLAAPPIDGKANKELMKFLAKRMGLARTDLAIMSGANGRRKVILVGDRDPETVVEALDPTS